MSINYTVTIGNKNTSKAISKHSKTWIETTLKDADVIIYTLFLPDYLNTIHVLNRFLSAQELARAQRYYHESDKNRFIICRGLLKLLLSFYTQLPVSKIELNYDNNKKPFLPSHPSVFFNVTHSKDHAIIAFSYYPVGVDVEYINYNYDILNNLDTIYNETEIASILKTKEKHTVFYKLWTRKEALVKAIGKGIDDDFPKVPSINGIHDIDTKLICTKENWNVADIKIASNYMAAVAFVNNKNRAKTVILANLPANIKDMIS